MSFKIRTHSPASAASVTPPPVVNPYAVSPPPVVNPFVANPIDTIQSAPPENVVDKLAQSPFTAGLLVGLTTGNSFAGAVTTFLLGVNKSMQKPK